MPVIRITDPDDPRIADYHNVPDPELLRRGGLFVVENRLVLPALLASRRFRTRSVLLSEAAFEALGEMVGSLANALPVYVCSKSLMEPISGFNIHRGCLALAERPRSNTLEEFLEATPGARRLVVLEGLTNADNVGGIFRNARAFGVDGVVLGPRCCDPLYRKAIRVSIGASLEIPFATAARWPEDVARIRQAGFVTIALTPSDDATDLEDLARASLPPRIALIVGNEGDGLTEEAQREADVRVRISMVAGVDSLNASTAAAIAMYRLAPDRA